MTDTPDYIRVSGGGAPDPHKTSHQDGGTDEISVEGLAGVLAAEQKSSWSGVSGKPSTFTPAAHASSHQDTGSDEISIAALSGESADEQKSTWAKVSGKPSTFTPEGHHARHEAGGDDVVAGGAIYPWLIDIDVFATPKATTGFTEFGLSSTYIYCAQKTSSGNRYDSIAWDVVLGAGTWTVQLIYIRGVNAGIYSIQFDSVEKGTIDGYGAAGPNIFGSVTGISVATTAKVELKLAINNKNTGSGGYNANLQHVRLMRTA